MKGFAQQELSSILAHSAPLGVASMQSVEARYLVTVDPPAEGQHIARLGAELNVVTVNEAVDLA